MLPRSNALNFDPVYHSKQRGHRAGASYSPLRLGRSQRPCLSLDLTEQQ
jgi:hypothetical protein